MCLYVRGGSVLLLSYIITAFFCILYILFAVNLKQSGAISIPTVASGFVSPSIACTEVLFGFPSVCRTVHDCFLTKTKYLCPDELVEF